MLGCCSIEEYVGGEAIWQSSLVVPDDLAGDGVSAEGVESGVVVPIWGCGLRTRALVSASALYGA